MVRRGGQEGGGEGGRTRVGGSDMSGTRSAAVEGDRSGGGGGGWRLRDASFQRGRGGHACRAFLVFFSLEL